MKKYTNVWVTEPISIQKTSQRFNPLGTHFRTEGSTVPEDESRDLRMMGCPKDLCAKLRDERIRRGLTLAEAAKAADVSVSAWKGAETLPAYMQVRIVEKLRILAALWWIE